MKNFENLAADAVCTPGALPFSEGWNLCDTPVSFLIDFAALCGYEDKPVEFVVQQLKEYLDYLEFTYAVDDLEEIMKSFYYHAACVAEYHLCDEIREFVKIGYNLDEAFKEWDV